MFDGISPGFDSAMTGFVALHAVAQIIGKMKLSLELDSTPVMFALFQGVKNCYCSQDFGVLLLFATIGFAVHRITIFNFCLHQLSWHRLSIYLYIDVVS